MAFNTRCPRKDCDSPDSFEIAYVDASRAFGTQGLALKIPVLRCSKCGAIISVLPPGT